MTKNVVQLIQASKEVFADHVFITVKPGKPRTPKIFWECCCVRKNVNCIVVLWLVHVC